MQTCTVCGLWYPSAGRDRLDTCKTCFEQNFAGAQPPLDVAITRAVLLAYELGLEQGRDVHAPMAREALEAYVEYVPEAHHITPRQAQALARMHVYWQRRQAGEDSP